MRPIIAARRVARWTAVTNPDPEKRVTQRDVARELGVSIATVSLGLRNSPEISPARCREIQAAAERMGYLPNPAAAELAHHRRRSSTLPIIASMAWINAWQPPDRLSSYRQFDAYWTGAFNAARKLGYQLEEFRLGDDLAADRLDRILSARGIRGIMLPPQRDQPAWGDFPWQNYSVIRFGRSLKEPACHIVSSDHVANAMRAFAEIQCRGYRRIGFLTDEDETMRRGGHHFEAGVLMAQRFSSEDERVPICVITRVPNSGRAERVARWVAGNGIDAVFTDVANAPDIIRRAALRIPEDVAVSATNVADIEIPAGIDQQPLEIGRVGALLLHSLISNHERGIPVIPRQVLVDGSWVDGASLPDRSV
ncbi:LacI family DNA-binding transcriptional regulator [Haloferula luteola]|uniref:LacI family DNA-binding transcriptional regulator n=1 Tax=Haloferula luteola TaxID=595692 RepID=UPI001C84E2B9|nr:LacI family DNA-binding transcriptional regulator [Haloferula luteola]